MTSAQSAHATKLARLTIRFKLNLVLAILAAAGFGMSATCLTFSYRERAELATAKENMQLLNSVLLPMRAATRDLQLDVIQVQQFLTDAAATHNEASFDDAAKYAADFKAQAQKLQALLGRLPQDRWVVEDG